VLAGRVVGALRDDLPAVVDAGGVGHGEARFSRDEVGQALECSPVSTIAPPGPCPTITPESLIASGEMFRPRSIIFPPNDPRSVTVYVDAIAGAADEPSSQAEMRAPERARRAADARLAGLLADRIVGRLIGRIGSSSVVPRSSRHPDALRPVPATCKSSDLHHARAVAILPTDAPRIFSVGEGTARGRRQNRRGARDGLRRVADCSLPGRSWRPDVGSSTNCGPSDWSNAPCQDPCLSHSPHPRQSP
jgi:hypothetical protein